MDQTVIEYEVIFTKIADFLAGQPDLTGYSRDPFSDTVLVMEWGMTCDWLILIHVVRTKSESPFLKVKQHKIKTRS